MAGRVIVVGSVNADLVVTTEHLPCVLERPSEALTALETNLRRLYALSREVRMSRVWLEWPDAVLQLGVQLANVGSYQNAFDVGHPLDRRPCNVSFT